MQSAVTINSTTDTINTKHTHTHTHTLAVPPSNQATPITLANTRQIGVKRTIELTKGSGGLGIGLTSRDVLTDNKSHPIYIKSIHPGGAAFQDGRLKLGDRLLSINGMDIQVRLKSIDLST